MKINFPKFFLYIVLVIMMSASIVGTRQESSILLEKNTVQTDIKKYPLQLKGKVYFVTYDQMLYSKISEYIFTSGFFVSMAIIFWLRKRKKH